MVLIKDVVTVVPTVLLSVFAVLGMAVLIGLSSWDCRSDWMIDLPVSRGRRNLGGQFTTARSCAGTVEPG
jgi:hypothetical protein